MQLNFFINGSIEQSVLSLKEPLFKIGPTIIIQFL